MLLLNKSLRQLFINDVFLKKQNRVTSENKVHKQQKILGTSNHNTVIKRAHGKGKYQSTDHTKKYEKKKEILTEKN